MFLERTPSIEGPKGQGSCPKALWIGMIDPAIERPERTCSRPNPGQGKPPRTPYVPGAERSYLFRRQRPEWGRGRPVLLSVQTSVPTRRAL